jgi:hypothetical protein
MGYLVFFGVLEVYAREWKPEPGWKLVTSVRYLVQKLHQNRRDPLRNCLRTIAEKNKWSVEITNDQVTIHIPKFSEMIDEYSQRRAPKNGTNIGTVSGQSRKNIGLDLDLEEEVDKEKEIKTTPTPSGQGGRVQAKTPDPGNGTKPGEQHARFAEFWKAYPKKRGKGQAERAWSRLKPTAELCEAMMQSLSQAKICPDWLKEGGRYIPHPATWLNAKGWEDDYGQPAQGPLAMFSEKGQRTAMNAARVLQRRAEREQGTA